MLSTIKWMDGSPKMTDAFCADNQYLYHFSSDIGLQKISIRSELKNPGIVEHLNDSVKNWGTNARMLFFNNRIFVRTIDDKSKPFYVVDPDTLKIDTDYPEPKFNEEAINSLGKF
jgi:hypothetical protein